MVHRVGVGWVGWGVGIEPAFWHMHPHYLEPTLLHQAECVGDVQI